MLIHALKKSGVFSDNAPILLANGFSPVPIAPGTKYPGGIEKWSALCEEPLTLQDIQGSALVYSAYGIGVACGYNNLIAIDIDTDDPEIIRIIEGALPDSVVKKRGKKGITLFYQFEGDAVPSFSFFDKSKKKFVDILGLGRQTVIPPTIHPETGEPYVWLTQKTLLNTSVHDLSKLKEAHLDALEQALSPYLWERPSWSADEGTKEALPAGHVFDDLERRRYKRNAEVALEACVKEVSEAQKGARNDTLFRRVCRLGKLIHHGLLDHDLVLNRMAGACRDNGLSRDDGGPSCMATFKSALYLSRNDPLPALVDRPKPGTDGKRGGNDAKGDAQESREWPEPGEIEAPLHPVASFNADELLPESFRDFVTDAANRMPCAVDYVAASLIVAAGAVIGARVGIKPKRLDDWVVVPNLWGGVVGDPSQKKSPAISEAMKPLNRLIARAADEFKKAQGDFELEKLITDAKREALEAQVKSAAKAGDKKQEMERLKEQLRSFIVTSEPDPVMRRHRTNDSTVEKLGELLRDNPNGLLVSRDELVGLLTSWDKAGHEGDRAFFLEGWNGTDSFDTDRIGRGSILIPNLCVSVFGGIQPDKLTGYLEQASNALANDGMLQRFQVLVYPDPVKWEYRDAIPNKAARERVNDVFEKLDGFDPVKWEAAPANQFVKFPHFQFDHDAQDIYIEFSKGLHHSIEREDNPLIRQHLAKYEKLFSSLALVLHLVDCAADGKKGQVTKAAAIRAAAWCRHLESHARRCYGLVADEGLRAAQALAKRIKDGPLPKNFNPEDFTARDVRRNQWRYLTTDDVVKAALDWLEDEGWIRIRKAGGTGPGPGRPTQRYEVNPAIRSASPKI